MYKIYEKNYKTDERYQRTKLMERCSMFMDRKTQSCQDVSSPKLDL